ncbi:MAG: hypothetical protein WKF75_00375 [Singulisphaera sp.]
MPKTRKDAPKRNDSPAKIATEVIDDAKVVATLRKITLAEYLSELLRPLVARDLDMELAKRSQARLGKAKGKPETRGS